MASTLDISLAEPFKTYVEAQTEAGDYGTPNQFIRELITDDRERRLARLEEQVRSALSEQPVRISPEEIEQGNFVSLFREKLRSLNDGQ